MSNINSHGNTKSPRALLGEALQRRHVNPSPNFTYTSTGPPHAPIHVCYGRCTLMYDNTLVQRASASTRKESRNEVCRKLLVRLPPLKFTSNLPWAVLRVPIKRTSSVDLGNHPVAVDVEWNMAGDIVCMQTATLVNSRRMIVTVLESPAEAQLHIACLGSWRTFVFLDGDQDRAKLASQWGVCFTHIDDVQNHLGRYTMSGKPGMCHLSHYLLGVQVDKEPRDSFLNHPTNQPITLTQCNYAGTDAAITIMLYLVARISAWSVDLIDPDSIHKALARFLTTQFLRV